MQEPGSSLSDGDEIVARLLCEHDPQGLSRPCPHWHVRRSTLRRVSPKQTPLCHDFSVCSSVSDPPLLWFRAHTAAEGCKPSGTFILAHRQFHT